MLSFEQLLRLGKNERREAIAEWSEVNPSLSAKRQNAEPLVERLFYCLRPAQIYLQKVADNKKVNQGIDFALLSFEQLLRLGKNERREAIAEWSEVNPSLQITLIASKLQN